LPARDELLRLHLFQGVYLVPEHGSRFEFQCLGCLLHPGDHPGQDFLVLTLQEQHGVGDLFCIISAADEAYAGSRRLRCAK
jgi:hypothetical protein